MAQEVSRWRVAALGALLALLAGRGAADEPAAGALTEEGTAVAVLSPRRRAVLSAQVSSLVVSVKKEEGETIEDGEPLVVLDDRDFQIELARVEARLATARANLDALEERALHKVEEAQVERARAVLARAEANLAAKEGLFRDRTLSAAEYEDARATVAVAKAELAVAEKELAVAGIDLAAQTLSAEALCRAEEANLDRARLEILRCTVAAPFSGRVVRILTREHEAAQSGTRLVEVVDDRTLLAHFLLESRSLEHVEIGRKVKVRIAETGREIEGAVHRIGALADPASSTVEVSILLANESRALRGGMRGTVRVAELYDPHAEEGR